MKYLLTFIFLLFLFKNTNAQINTETQDLYLKSFERYIEEFDVYKEKGIGIIKPEKIFLIESNFLDSIPKYINGIEIIEITRFNRDEFFKSKKINLDCVSFNPIEIDKNEIKITISETNDSLEDKKRSIWKISAGSWFLVYFRFDTTTLKWELTRTELKGI